MAVDRARVLGSFRGLSAGQRFYMNVRWWVCPFDRVLAAIPERGRLLDVGCGSGLWLTYLGLERPELLLEGVDPDPTKLAMAASSGVAFERLHEGDALNLPEGPFDCITVFDVLYLLSDDDKERALLECMRALRPGGRLVVKELDTKPLWKLMPSRLQEVISVRLVNLTHGDRLHFQSIDSLARAASDIGFEDVDVQRVDEGYLHPHVVMQGRRPG